jgi:hypothetical protein
LRGNAAYGGKTLFQGRVYFVFKILRSKILKTKHTRPYLPFFWRQAAYRATWVNEPKLRGNTHVTQLYFGRQL